MRRRILVATLSGLLLISVLTAEGQSNDVADLLRAVTARIIVSNSNTQQSGLCHGLVYLVRRSAYIATAKHCLEEPAGTALSSATPFNSLGIDVEVTYANDDRGQAFNVAWSPNFDVAVLVTSFEHIPDSWVAMCPSCKIYRNFGANQRIPIMSMLSAGSGAPVVSSGFVVSNAVGSYLVVLPSAQGTSGSRILDLRGTFVGTVVSGLVYSGSEAGWTAGIVPGNIVQETVDYAYKHYDSLPWTRIILDQRECKRTFRTSVR